MREDTEVKLIAKEARAAQCPLLFTPAAGLGTQSSSDLRESSFRACLLKASSALKRSQGSFPYGNKIPAQTVEENNANVSSEPWSPPKD